MIEEIWKPIIGYENLFQISNYGNVRNLPKQSIDKSRNRGIIEARLFSSHYDQKGYLRIRLWHGENKTFITHKIHRLVAQHFISNPDQKPMINHKDGNKANNYFENLEWSTNAENIQHAYDIGLIKNRRKSKQFYSNN
jgi:hypothetical protein